MTKSKVSKKKDSKLSKRNGGGRTSSTATVTAAAVSKHLALNTDVAPQYDSQQDYGQMRVSNVPSQGENFGSVPPPPMDAIFSTGVIPTINNEMLQYQSLKNNVRAPLFSSIHSLVTSTPKGHIIAAIKRVEISFPECLFFHVPTFENKLEDVNHILIGALLAVCSFSSPFVETDLKQEFNSEDKWLGVNSFQVKNCLYEKLALDAIFNNCLFLSKPDIEICQALLLLACVKWGQNDYYAAWMLHGCAARLIQAIQFDERFQHNCKEDPLLNEVRTRTFWSAFSLDRVISTGEGHCFAVNNYTDVELPLPNSYFFKLSSVINNSGGNMPLSGDMYNLSKLNPQASNNEAKNNVISSNAQAMAAVELQMKSKVTIGSFVEFYKTYPHLLYENERSAYIKCYSLWGIINQYMMEGGRAKRANEVPWDLENSTVGKLTKEVEEFWAIMPAEWKWENLDYARQRQINMKKLFIITTINCCHCLITIFCIREYLPFLPSKEQGPCGPTEPPFMPQPPYPTYWADTSKKCFAAVRRLCEILEVVFEVERQSSSGSINLIESSPFFSFCAFVCAIQCNYGSCFPFMDPDAASYKNDKRKSLPYCYKYMIKILKSREEICPVTKNWLHMVFKVQGMYKSVASNMAINNEKDSNSTSQRQVYPPAQPSSSMSDPNLNSFQPPADAVATSQGSTQGVQPQTVPDFTAPLSSGQHQISPSDSMMGNREQISANSSSFISRTGTSVMDGTTDKIFNSNSENSKNNALLSVNQPSPTRRNALASGPNSCSSSNPCSTPRFPIEVEPETDKLSLLFTDQEFEMLMQFSK
ncbi:unnamed protein product [Kluyveromyces dobzhanskii CBS 2104]|uniref:WGS project CCBQ000000000 data, contig 00272 n=1 Tax=Kluyveromyces dobzhanskii CBS 2104 TaxID=1427455 RepID=A0A0A8L8U1_9SACH|nr:unnamed protein product [Kluyveromyces dobzhanskii CBS 2104]